MPVRRTDWLFRVSTAVPGASGQQQWEALRFPDAAPPRAVDARAHMPPDGYGQEALRSVRRKHAPRKVPEVLIRELLATNGYHSIGSLPEKLAAHGLGHVREEGS